MPPRRKSAEPDEPLLPPGERARGALLGLAVGDAFGAPLRSRLLVAPPFPRLADGPALQPQGGGPLKLRKGQVSDETQLATCLGWTLRTVKRYDASDALRRYRAWSPHAVELSDPQVRQVLAETESGLPPLGAGRRVWVRSGRQLAGGGSLARTAPLAVFLAHDARALMQASFEDSALTHFDPRCQLACAAFNAALARALNTHSVLEPQELITAALSGLSVAAAALARQESEHVQEVTAANALLREDLALAQQDDPELYGPLVHMHRHAELVRVPFRLAFWQLLHAPTLEAALVDVVNRGGAADTNAAVTGALLGAFHGESALPLDWRTAVLEAFSRVGGPLWGTYHPRHLLPLVED